MLKNILVGTIFFCLGALGWMLLKGTSTGSSRSMWILIEAIGLLFLANGVYGLFSGRVFGRSWKNYWGGWIYRQEEPFHFWSFALGHLIVGIFLLVVGWSKS